MQTFVWRTQEGNVKTLSVKSGIDYPELGDVVPRTVSCIRWGDRPATSIEEDIERCSRFALNGQIS